MVDAAASVEWIVASGEVDALMLEFNLIQQYLPRFNIRYRDDKSYPYLALTVGETSAARPGPPRDQAEEGPLLRAVRARLGDPGHPGRADPRLPDPHLHESLLRPARRAPGDPVSTTTSADARSLRPDHHGDHGGRRIGATSTRSGTSSRGTRSRCSGASKRRWLRRRVGRSTSRRRGSATSSRRRAGRWRAREMVLVQPESLDVVGLAEDDLEAAFQVFTVRGGRVLGGKGWIVDRVEDLDRPELVASFLRQLYMEREEVPPRVLVPTEPADRGVGDLALDPSRFPRHDRRAGARRQAAPDGGRGEQREAKRSIGTSSDVPRTSGRWSRGAVRARRSARPRASTPSASSATTSRTSGRATRWDPWWSSRTAPEAKRRLPPVRDQGRARTGRFREHGGDAHPPVLTTPEREGTDPVPSGRRRFSYPPALVVVDGGRGSASRRGSSRTSACTSDSGSRSDSRRSTSPTARIRCRSRGSEALFVLSTSVTRHTGSRSRITVNAATVAPSPLPWTRSPAWDSPKRALMKRCGSLTKDPSGGAG